MRKQYHMFHPLTVARLRRSRNMMLLFNALLFLGVLHHSLTEHSSGQDGHQLSEQSAQCIESKMFNPVDYSPTNPNVSGVKFVTPVDLKNANPAVESPHQSQPSNQN